MYYSLKEECILVEGKLRGAIYDFASGRVYSVNHGAVEFLKACQDSNLEDFLDITLKENERFLSFLDTLTTKGLGAFYYGKQAAKQRSLPCKPPKLEYVWFELTSTCNNRCLHCYSASSPEVPAGSLPHSRWLELITEARQEGASGLQLIGGEPLLYPKWRELVLKAREENYELIEIFTNATLINDDCVKFFKEHNVSIATTIYADNAATHDKITLHPGSFEKTMTAINKILAENIPLRIASIIMKANENEAENIMKLCTRLGVEATPPDVVRPTGRGNDQQLLPQVYTKPPIKPPFFTDPESFLNAQSFHSCLAGRLAITATGDVIPCIFAREQICGNILSSDLHTILNGQPLKNCWQTTKDRITKCQDCEYRYACPDCRPLAQNQDPQNSWNAPPADCSYNPYTGSWEDD
ncbi:radical SAM/SPASM domain-containing protein [Sporomusa acidovorans]|uniref:PqqA peptide cyclase n=1 Tax=Sporomusa acidovorans (strain ATCC 49682 / DSM 3132 / Mol) TaxID=1123286 RepID=A0ABZ3J1A6_SPOA4|nr:radical SAM protein [Sporomusa acidovorans]OZC14447.1 antilisterial bacteriocin subtilosin biosynthesis protein AlbA [Sporomusa acidovorans DSM 3132]SDF50151.1 radical SAM additional 4Fe4S-binding SPASM domain-containing protein [Sporomusa acidovorans]